MPLEGIMSELLLANNYGKYEDGDIVHAMNDLRIHDVHAQHICVSRNLDNKTKQWNDAILAECHHAKTYQYKTERISATEIRVTDQRSMNSIVKSDVPNQYGHVIYVEEFFRRLLASNPQLVFGSPGAEVFYHGKYQYLTNEDSDIWQQIEVRTSNRKVDYGRFNWDAKDGKSHLQNYLAIVVDDFDNAERGRLESSLYDDKDVRIAKRKYNVDWRNLPGMNQSTIDDVLAVDTPGTGNEWGGGTKVDIRESASFTRSAIVEEKSAVVIG